MTCKKSCSDDPTCNGVECGGGYCSWWKRSSCASDNERTMKHTRHSTCMKLSLVDCFQRKKTNGPQTKVLYIPNVNNTIKCQSYCQNYRACHYFVLNINTGSCNLKNILATSSTIPSAKHIFGPKFCPENEWNEWSAYGSCCNGVQARGRSCNYVYDSNKCIGNNVETRLCTVTRQSNDSCNGMLDKLWPKIGDKVIVPYTFPASASILQKAAIARAILEIGNKTCVSFEQRNGQSDWVHIDTNRYGCRTRVGKTGGRQRLCARDCKFYYCNFGQLIHQMLHVLGLVHEHQRVDRDSYIDVNFDEIEKAEQENYMPSYSKSKSYEKCSVAINNCGIETGTPYDCNSILHPPTTLGIQNRTVITTKERNKNCSYGQRNTLSELDAMDVNTVYGCS